MTQSEVANLVAVEIGGDYGRTNHHNLNLRDSLVTPRLVPCRNTFPDPEKPKPRILKLWVVLEEAPGQEDSYLIVFNDQMNKFGLASNGENGPVFLGYHGTFWAAFDGM